MTGVVATLLVLAWAPSAPDRWLAPSKDEHADIACDHGEWHEVSERLAKSAAERLERAYFHPDAKRTHKEERVR